jgi:site-specific recombinase XerD
VLPLSPFGAAFAAAGIPKRDDRGRTVDVHALRHTFGTHLSKNGVAPRTAQAAMPFDRLTALSLSKGATPRSTSP